MLNPYFLWVTKDQYFFNFVGHTSRTQHYKTVKSGSYCSYGTIAQVQCTIATLIIWCAESHISLSNKHVSEEYFVERWLEFIFYTIMNKLHCLIVWEIIYFKGTDRIRRLGLPLILRIKEPQHFTGTVASLFWEFAGFFFLTSDTHWVMNSGTDTDCSYSSL